MRKVLLIIACLHLMSCASNPTLDAKDGGFTIEELRASAEAASYAGAYRDALLNYQSILRKEPDNLLALVGAGESLLAAEQPARANLYFERALTIEPVDVGARRGRAFSWLMQGRYADARRSLQNLVDDGVEDWRVWNALGVIADLDADFDDSSYYYQKAIDAEPHRAMLYNNLGYSQNMGHAYADAERSLKQARLYAPGDQRIINNLAMAVAWQKKYIQAVEILMDVLDEASSYNNVGYVAYLNADYEVAEEYFRKAIRLKPSYYKRAALNLELTLRKKKHAPVISDK